MLQHKKDRGLLEYLCNVFCSSGWIYRLGSTVPLYYPGTGYSRRPVPIDCVRTAVTLPWQRLFGHYLRVDSPL